MERISVPAVFPPPPRNKRVAILQSNYIPWKGYFDLIRSVDEFILFDEVQYTRRDWRNRNRIKTQRETQWLTIPVQVKGKYLQTIQETMIEDTAWSQRHWCTLCHCYGKAPFFGNLRDVIETAYRQASSPYLSEVNAHFLRIICGLLGITTPITWSRDYRRTAAGKSQRLLEICLAAGATAYLSGPAARSYLEESIFGQAGVSVHWMDYAGYPEYPQLCPPFDHAVTILDGLFMVGPEFIRFMKGTRDAA
jgi:hypothetical protein